MHCPRLEAHRPRDFQINNVGLGLELTRDVARRLNDSVLADGASKVRPIAEKTLATVREKIGLGAR